MEHLILGLKFALQPDNLLVMLLGSLVGTLIGALPGLGASVGVALLLPFTYDMPALTGLLLLVALYQACEYGGSISSILICAPGTPAATATLIDGYPLCRKGYPGKALGYSLTASTIGGFFGVAVLILFSAPIAKFALRFGAPEYFSLGIFGLTAVASLSSRDIPKSILSVIFGLLLTTVGIDVFTGFPRFSFGRVELYEGIPLIPILIGLFAVSEVYKIIGEELNRRFESGVKGLNVWLTFKEISSAMKATFLGAVIGTVVGIFPGLGAGPASWLAYTEAKRRSRHPEKFGTGHPEGIAAPEAANNA
ncbi:MAG: putative tricarboxylic transport rane protein, partial [Clostridia bacterium]|nr:putative tricarboxylic transport rane protein [Clostridia bacterium]